MKKKSMNRREFLSRCAVCTTCVAAAPLMSLTSCRKSGVEEKLKIRILYSLHDVKQPGPDWPNVGFDFGPIMDRISTELALQCPEFVFESSMAKGPEEAEKILAEDAENGMDGYVVYQLNCWNRVVQPVVASEKPVLYVDFKYGGSGGFLVYTARFLRDKTPNLAFVASSSMEDQIAAVKCFKSLKKGGTVSDFVAAVEKSRIKRMPPKGDLSCLSDEVKTISAEECLERMKNSKILAVRNQESGPADPIMGIPMERVSFSEINEAWKAADKDQAREVADRWQNSAAEIVGVSRETLETSAAMYLGMKFVLEKHRANAITINCLGGFYGGHIHAYPCLGFHELNNEGLVGGCECDVRSAATMTAVTALTRGRPGFISDPVLDTGKRQIIYAHCVASNKVFGPQGPANPFTIMTHSEDRQGASVRSILPTGYLTTTLEIHPQRREILFHQAKAVGNDPDDRACRTKLCAEPIGDMEKLFSMWDVWGWHRVTFYGDLKGPVYALADAMNWKVIEEA
ncbi:MAG: hypothetical protein PVI11_01910 [Candidatus Aminicenantes bacterium]